MDSFGIIDVSSEGPSSGVSSGGSGKTTRVVYPILSCVSLPGIILCIMIYISLFTLCFDEIHLIGFYFVT